MPVRKVGKDCYQWGNQKVYCGKGAKHKAMMQGIAIQSTGWREAEDARDFAKEKHEGQMYGDKPYMTHVEDVASGFDDLHLKRIAYLHDVVEDTDVTIGEIRDRFGKRVSVAVDALTRRKEPYFDYIRRVKQNPEATQIKLADLHANLKNNPKESLAKRYRKAIKILTKEKVFEAEEIDFNTIPDLGLTFPSALGVIGKKSDRPLWLRHGHYVIGTTNKGWWRVWDLDRNDWVGWNFSQFPLFQKYWDWLKESPEDLDYSDMESFEDAIALADWKEKANRERAESFHQGDDTLSTTFMSKTERRALKMHMSKMDKENARHPNRGSDWIPIRLIKSKAQTVREELECPTCGEKMFGTLVEAKRHHFYCNKYGFQPPNQLYFTPMSLFVARTLHKKKNR